MGEVPAHYRQAIDPAEFIVAPTALPDQRIDVGVLFVGAGVAGLSGAIRLAQLLGGAPELRERLGETPIAVIEKGKAPGAHLVSGAVVDPRAFRRLFRATPDAEFPFRCPVPGESIYLLTSKWALPAPIIPPPMRNHGNFVASVSEIGRWLAGKAEALGVTVLNETSAVKALVSEGAVRGVLTGDKGRGRDGSQLSNFEPGAEILARATVLSEGVTGHLTGALIQRYGLAGPNPQIYALGVKEVWDVPKPLDRVIHTMGWPLRWGAKHGEFGGSFIYPLGDRQVSMGLVVGLDTADATVSVHDLLQQFKGHPLVHPILEGGNRAEGGWGAKTIPEGGFYSLPSRLGVPGAYFVGDAAGFVNVPALKGIHYAMESGILAAEAIFQALSAGSDPGSDAALRTYEDAVKASFLWSDLRRVRNMRQVFKYGLLAGSFLAGLLTVTRGRFPWWRISTHADAERPVFVGGRPYPKADGSHTFDKLSSVYASGNRTRDTQPNHLRVQADVPEAVGEAWIHMCPAAVYEWGTDGQGKRTLLVNPTNCVQCGAITAKGGRLTPPEGGSGPEYTIT